MVSSMFLLPLQLLQFMYGRSISVTSNEKLLKLLILADRFMVPSCVVQCGELLHGGPWTAEDAIACIQLPDSIQTSNFGRMLVDKGKEFLMKMYHDVKEWRTMPDLLLLPVAAMETIVCNPKLRVECERDLLEMVLEYVRQQFPKDENKEEHEVVLGQLAKHVRFRFLEAEYLRDLLSKPEMKNEICSGLIQEALYFRIASTKEQYKLELSAVPKHWRYTKRPGSHEISSIYMDVSYQNVFDLQERGRTTSRSSCVEGMWFDFSLRRCKGKEANDPHTQANDPHTLGLYLQCGTGNPMQMRGAILVEYEFFCKFGPSSMYRPLIHGTSKFFQGGHSWGFSDAFNSSWEKIVRDDSPYFHFGAMFLRVDVHIKENIEEGVP